MVARNLTVPHRFVCLSNVNIDGVERIPLELGLPGWWSKLELFGAPFESAGRVLYLDLDVVVTGCLDEIATFPAPIAFSPPHHVLVGQPEPRSRPGFRPLYQTSCMVWSPPAGYEIFSRFTGAAMQRLNGDQDFIAECNPDYPVMPREWFAKLRHCPQGPEPGVKVVFGGAVKNDDARFKWVKDYWQGDGNLQRPKSSMAHAGY